ncbi:type IV pilus biogenesis protein PilI [Escherichia coli]|uniref:type IV pilus biogenesis protein PilI n=1 Tax=Escherichia coli TaxID=562 RepID=UPI00201A7C9D|nr:PilI type IV pilus biogenesis protein [Escherichia coli]
MPQQHPGRLQILVVDAHCKRRLFQRKHRQTPMSLPDVSARRITVSWWYYATTDFCSDWSVLPAATAAGTRQQLPPSASTGLAIMNATEAKCLFNGV